MKTTLHGLVEAAAADHPDRIAVVDGDRSISYAELDAQANRIASVLMGLGVKRGDRVAIYLEKSIETFAGLYGVLKCGAAYVPLDPSAPAGRLAYVAGNCGVGVILTSEAKRAQWADVTANTAVRHLVVLDADEPEGSTPGIEVHGRARIETAPADSPDAGAIELDLAYILYTSGSTGDPKGVKLSHLNALTFIRWVVDEFEVNADDRLSNHAPLHFDLSTLDLFAAAHAAARVVIVPPKASVFPVQIARFIESNEITIWYSVPSILSMLTRRGGLTPGSLPTLRVVFFAGEVFPTKYLRELRALVPDARFANLYGPTETNVCTWHEVGELPEDDSPIPIGRPITGVDAFAVSEEGERLGVGEVGELWVRGATVMQGYWANPERTSRARVANPFMPEVADAVYRTGDLVRQRPDGAFDFLGRRDAQIKSRGYRIELGDIEAALNAHPGVLECAVVPVPDDMFTNRILAYVAAASGVSDKDLVAHCRARLPSYMVPEMWQRSDSLPKTSTGKIDRRALADTPVPVAKAS